MKILQLCYKMPFPQKDGGASSIYHTALGLLHNRVNLKILAVNTPKDWVEPETVPPAFAAETRFEFVKIDTRVKPLNAIANLFTSSSYFVSRFHNRAFELHLAQLLKNEKFDVIQLEHLYLCVYLKTIRKHSSAKVVLRAQNVEFRLWERIINNTNGAIKKLYLAIAIARLRKFEKSTTEKVDGIIAISPEDAEMFKKIAPETPVIAVPMGYNFEKIQGYESSTHFEHFPVFYHLGSMDWIPNIEGLKWFIEKVIPVVVAVYPDLRFHLAGKKMPAWFYEQQNSNIIVDGEVEDALRYQSDKAILVVPLLSGGGLRVKIIEGMALGKTVISTSIGAEGIPCTHLKNILIANNPLEFAEQMGKCYQSSEFCKQIGENARQFARENYDCKNTGKLMISFYNSITDKQKGE